MIASVSGMRSETPSPRPGWLVMSIDAAQALDGALDHVHADAAARQVGDRRRGREARREDQLQQFVIAQHLARLDQALGLGLGADPGAVDAAAVVADGDDHLAAR
jgi:hypothetical protein